MCAESDIMPKGVVSVDAYIGENVDVKSSGLHPGGTFQSKNMSWKQEELGWSPNRVASPSQLWSANTKSEGAVKRVSGERSSG